MDTILKIKRNEFIGLIPGNSNYRQNEGLEAELEKYRAVYPNSSKNIVAFRVLAKSSLEVKLDSAAGKGVGFIKSENLQVTHPYNIELDFFNYGSSGTYSRPNFNITVGSYFIIDPNNSKFPAAILFNPAGKSGAKRAHLTFFLKPNATLLREEKLETLYQSRLHLDSL